MRKKRGPRKHWITDVQKTLRGWSLTHFSVQDVADGVM